MLEEHKNISEEEDLSGTFGIDHVQEGKSYTVVNGQWNFDVLSVYEDTVVVAYEHGNMVLSKKRAKSTCPIWVKEVKEV